MLTAEQIKQSLITGCVRNEKGWECPNCTFVDVSIDVIVMHYMANHREIAQNQKASRFAVKTRYDILDTEFLHAMAKIANHGANKYGEFNYQKSRLSGKDGAINHIFNHIRHYQLNEQYDHPDVGHERKYHLAAIAFNAMMEFWYECHPEVK